MLQGKKNLYKGFSSFSCNDCVGLCSSHKYNKWNTNLSLFICLVIFEYCDNQEKICSQISVFTYIYVTDNYCQHQYIRKFTMHSLYNYCPYIVTHTFSISFSLLGSQFSWHHGSTWPLKCIRSITKFIVAICLAVVVIVLREVLVAYFFRWQPSS